MEQKEYTYKLSGIKNSNAARFLDNGYILVKEDKLEDEIINLSKVENLGMTTDTVLLDDRITADFFNCILTESFIRSTKKMPLMYTHVLYSTDLITNLLITINVWFTMNDDVKTETMNNFINKKFSGKYSIELKIDDKITTFEISKYEGYKNMLDYLIKFMKSTEIMNIIKIQEKKRIKERHDKYGNIGNFIPLTPIYNISDLQARYKRGENIDDLLK